MRDESGIMTAPRTPQSIGNKLSRAHRRSNSYHPRLTSTITVPLVQVARVASTMSTAIVDASDKDHSGAENTAVHKLDRQSVV